MAENSKIEWTDHTFNPWEGCTKVSPGCVNCYAETRNARFGGGTAPNWGKGAPRRRTSTANWKLPEKWDREVFRQCLECGHRGAVRIDCPPAGEAGTPNYHCSVCDSRRLLVSRPRVFCASLADWLDPEVPIQWLADLLELVRSTPNLDWLLLTKRPELWRSRIDAILDPHGDATPTVLLQWWLDRWRKGQQERDNVWIGTTVENQAMADKRIPELLKIPAKVRFLSCEPLLGALDLDQPRCDCHDRDEVAVDADGFEICGECAADGFSGELSNGHWLDPLNDKIHWVICGGESGTNARPMHPDWARSLRDQCAEAGVPFLFKQWGEWVPCGMVEDETQHPCQVIEGTIMCRVGKKAAGRLLDGREHNEFPQITERKDGK